MKSVLNSLAVISIGLLLIIGVNATQATIMLQNGSFENRVLGDQTQDFFSNSGTWSLPSWVQWNGAGTGAGYMFDRNTTNWGTAYPGTTNAPDGNQVLGLGRGAASSVYQDLGTVTAGESYTLSGWLGRPNDTTGNATGYIMQLSVGTSYYGSTAIMTLNNSTFTDPAKGTWSQFSGTSSVITGAQAGQHLYVFLYSEGVGGWPNYREFDKLAVSTVPEPAVLVLLSLGGLMIRRRK